MKLFYVEKGEWKEGTRNNYDEVEFVICDGDFDEIVTISEQDHEENTSILVEILRENNILEEELYERIVNLEIDFSSLHDEIISHPNYDTCGLTVVICYDKMVYSFENIFLTESEAQGYCEVASLLEGYNEWKYSELELNESSLLYKKLNGGCCEK